EIHEKGHGGQRKEDEQIALPEASLDRREHADLGEQAERKDGNDDRKCALSPRLWANQTGHRARHDDRSRYPGEQIRLERDPRERRDRERPPAELVVTERSNDCAEEYRSESPEGDR